MGEEWAVACCNAGGIDSKIHPTRNIPSKYSLILSLLSDLILDVFKDQLLVYFKASLRSGK